MATDEITDEDATKLLTRALAANDLEHLGWPKEGVEHATWLWQQTQGRVPSYAAVVNYVGAERAQALVPQILEQRKFHNLLLGHRSPCHYCNVEYETLQHYDFALMRVQETNRKWGETAVSAAISVATLPLLGAGMLRMLGKVHSGAALHLRLVACQKCRSKNSNFLGLFMLNEARASNHPAWEALHSAGFTKFLDEEKMPFGLKSSIGRDGF